MGVVSSIQLVGNNCAGTQTSAKLFLYFALAPNGSSIAVDILPAPVLLSHFSSLPFSASPFLYYLFLNLLYIFQERTLAPCTTSATNRGTWRGPTLVAACSLAPSHCSPTFRSKFGERFSQAMLNCNYLSLSSFPPSLFLFAVWILNYFLVGSSEELFQAPMVLGVLARLLGIQFKE